MAASSPAFLPDSVDLKRLPRAAWRQRPPDFLARFESRALFYDCFWNAAGDRVLLVGPPPLNLRAAFLKARFSARPGGRDLEARCFISESVMVTELAGAPSDTTEIACTLADRDWVLPVQPSGVTEFAGRRLLFTMSKDNELAWIAEWAGYHARRHGADAIVFFDNGSTRYGMEDLAATLSAVPGIDTVALHSWPWLYGAPDPAIFNNPFYALFLQVASMSVALRRYGERAEGLLNCDIDELVAAPDKSTIFDLAHRSREGLVVFTGQFVEPIPAPRAVPPFTHADFTLRLKDPKARLSRPRKWALDPSRPWVRSLAVHPYMHWIHGRPAFSKTSPEGVFYWHFKGISTGWKDRRAEIAGLDPGAIEPDPLWRGWVADGGGARS